jgi:hypothetical protein
MRSRTSKTADSNEAAARILLTPASLQGWRTSMEDAHAAELDIDGQNSVFFGVYDGWFIKKMQPPPCTILQCLWQKGVILENEWLKGLIHACRRLVIDRRLLICVQDMPAPTSPSTHRGFCTRMCVGVMRTRRRTMRWLSR